MDQLHQGRMLRRPEQEKNRRPRLRRGGGHPDAFASTNRRLHLLLMTLVWAGVRQHDRDQRKPHRSRLGFDQFPPHSVHGNPVELLVERGQEPDDNKIVTLAQHV